MALIWCVGFSCGTRWPLLGRGLIQAALVDPFYTDAQAMGGRRCETSSLVRRLRRG